jgi:hypothetical protein
MRNIWNKSSYPAERIFIRKLGGKRQRGTARAAQSIPRPTNTRGAKVVGNTARGLKPRLGKDQILRLQ